jgi:hypothetical protein
MRFLIKRRRLIGFCSVVLTSYALTLWNKVYGDKTLLFLFFLLRILLLSEHAKCVISGSGRDLNEICVLLGFYTVSKGSSVPTFRGNLSDLFSRVKSENDS